VEGQLVPWSHSREHISGTTYAGTIAGMAS
jgi:hypothetical protein